MLRHHQDRRDMPVADLQLVQPHRPGSGVLRVLLVRFGNRHSELLRRSYELQDVLLNQVGL